MKSDDEPAIVAVRKALARCHGGRATPEQPPTGEHQANGSAEKAERTIRDQARVLMVTLQVQIGEKWRRVSPSWHGLSHGLLCRQAASGGETWGNFV